MTATKEPEMSGNMPIHKTPAPGWVGGFAQSNQAFEYPNPDVSSLPVLGNLDNIDKLERQMKVLWPEFSWTTTPGDEETRAFQMFAPDISRLGYTNEGRIYSIICPQQGAYSKLFGAFNVEVTVTGQRGWADESARQAEMMAADMSVVGVIWFSDTPDMLPQLKLLKKYAEIKFRDKNYNFPISKEYAIKVRTHKVGNPKQVLFPLRTGLSERFTAPSFTRHDDQAFTVSNLDVQIGNIIPTGCEEIDAFNQAILDLFNVAKGNMLKAGNILTWNVWFEAPTVVDQKEWAEHAEYWRTSIDTDHGSPGGSESKMRRADGTVFHPLKEVVFEAVKKLLHYTEQTDSLVKGIPYEREISMSGNMVIHDTPAPGWVGGFAESNCAFSYPNPDLRSLEVLDNLDNIDKLQRQMKVLWPEFSWQSIPGDEKSRCFQMFAPDISRLGYTNEGRVYSIICPQQGSYSKLFGSMNVEVTVTGQRGWANESASQAEMMAADMSVVGKIWFSETEEMLPLLKKLRTYARIKFAGKPYNFPIEKKYAVQVRTHKVGNPDQVLFPLRTGLSERFEAPKFTRHDDEAFTVSTLDVEIGDVIPTGDTEIDHFNKAIMKLFNAAKGNMLAPGNILTWNVWFEAPTHVHVKEWRKHADYWRWSLETDHGSPGGNESKQRYADGTEFKPLKSFLEQASKQLMHFTEQSDSLEQGLPYERDMSGNMEIHDTPAPGWVGGFVDTNPKFSYPNPILTSLPPLDNLDNIDKLQRQMKVLWPEFSWQSVVGDESSRCFQRFAPDISRIGYTDEGRVYSIICPQRAVYIDAIGSFNVEVTVTGQRGWVNESASHAEMMAADLSVVGKVWITETEGTKPIFKKLRKFAELKFAGKDYNFPIAKEFALEVSTHKVGNPKQVLFPLRTGQSERFEAPAFATHEDQAFTVSYLDVEIGNVVPTGIKSIDTFNNTLLKAFNLFRGNMLAPGNILTWNVWFEAPTLVDNKEWANHAEYWRASLKTGHGSPGGPDSKQRYADGTEFKPIQHAWETLKKEFGHYFEQVQALEKGIVLKSQPKLKLVNNKFVGAVSAEDDGMSGNMHIHDTPAPGWVGGFVSTNPGFAYPNPDLSSLPVLGNLDNIDKLERQMKVLWPEFSWQARPGEESSRCFQMFAPDISRLGYTDEGRVYSIICPQQGAYSKLFGAFNVEVTVTGQRGWADESAPKSSNMAADMSVVGAIWFSEQQVRPLWLKALKRHYEKEVTADGGEFQFPDQKKHAIIVETYKVGDPSQPLFALRTGLSERFTAPGFTRHDDEAFTVSNLDVEIGGVRPTGNAKVDEFNNIILDLFNVVKGNMLKKGNILTWNVWFEAPTIVDQKEWTDHAEYWRTSIETDHGSPGGSESIPRYADGTEFKPAKNILDALHDKLKQRVESFLP